MKERDSRKFISEVDLMKAVFYAGKDKYGQAKSRIYADELVSRQSITVRDNAALGMKKEGYYILIEGDEHAIKHAKEMLKGLADALAGKEELEVLSAIQQQESSAAEGFGAIFG